jgi:hypothetical protein
MAIDVGQYGIQIWDGHHCPSGLPGGDALADLCDSRLVLALHGQRPLPHRVVGFHAAVAFQALSAREAQARHLRRRLLLEDIDQGGFADARLSGDQDKLSLALHGPVQIRVQCLQQTRASHQMAVYRRSQYSGFQRRDFVDRGDETIPAPGRVSINRGVFGRSSSALRISKMRIFSDSGLT